MFEVVRTFFIRFSQRRGEEAALESEPWPGSGLGLGQGLGLGL